MMIQIAKNIVAEMTQGNFSFAILIVGIIQIFAMLKNKRNK